ncbi:MAG: SemiSWEET family sugar transporter [Rhodospirillaceae bacterium]
MDTAGAIGAVASLCSVVSFTPQAWKIIKSRHTDDISAGMFVLTVTGFALWTAYGVLLGKWPIIITNAICFVLAGFILMMKLLPSRKKNKVADALDPEA